MRINKKALMELLLRVKEDMYKFKEAGELVIFDQLYYPPALDLSRYNENGEISLNIGTIDSVKTKRYYLNTKLGYELQMWELFSDKLGKHNEKIVIGLIDYFVEKVLDQLEGKEEVDIKQVIKSFISELEDEPVPVHIKLLLDGVFLINEKPFDVNINSINFLLRRPNTKDFIVRPQDVSKLSEAKVPTAILEISMTMKPSFILSEVHNGFDEFNIIMEKAILILRLFKLGEIVIIDRKVTCQAIQKLIWFGNYVGLPNKAAPLFTKYRYGLDEIEYNRLRYFWEWTYDKIHETEDHKTKRKSILTPFSYDLYRDAVNDTLPKGKSIAYTVIGLEGIFNNSEDNTEVSYKLRLRGAKIIGLLTKEDEEKLVKLLKVGYSIRSKFAHGSGIEISKEEKIILKLGFSSIDDFVKKLIDYLRVSIILDLFIIDRNLNVLFYQDLDNLLVKNEIEPAFIDKYLKEVIDIINS